MTEINDINENRADRDETFPLYAGVYVDISSSKMNKPFSYGIPDQYAKKVHIGSAVRVPFGRRSITGYITDLTEYPPSLKKGIKLKPIDSIIESGDMWDREMIDLARWIEAYYGCSFVKAVKALIPAPVRPSKEGRIKKQKTIRKAQLLKTPEDEMEKIEKRAPVQAKILNFLLERKKAVLCSEIIEKLNASYTSLNSLKKKGWIKIFSVKAEVAKSIKDKPPAKRTENLELTPHQKEVYERLLELEKSEKAKVALLHGVTGSGKTEIYLQVIDQVLKKGRDALVLVPEISLTPQAVERFEGRFGEDIAVLHSRLTDAERRDMWWRIRNKKARVVLGARSAVFAPLENIGVIVVDEEHESSYKQEKEPRYHARQIAVRRALMHKSLVILGSATPSFEVYNWAKEGRYEYLELPERIGLSVMPQIQIVDLKEDFADKRKGIIGDTLRAELGEVIINREQAILFMNRRGFSSFLLCVECGGVINCPDCDVSLTFHKYGRLLKCHHCEYQRPAPELCPFCGGNRLKDVSHGIQKVEEELQELFPGISCIRMDRDTTSGRDAHYRLLKKFAETKATVLLGTQMVAKGLDFPGVTLVGALLADVSLHLPDFRSLERTYQILTQVAGRAGRRERQGRVVVQTYNPDSPVILAVQRQDYDEFFKWEKDNREKLNYPPFGHLINLIFTGKDSDRVREYSLAFGDLLRRKEFKDRFTAILGPAPCPLGRIKSRYRWHLTLKGRKTPPMTAVVKGVAAALPPPTNINFSIDVDPVSLM